VDKACGYLEKNAHRMRYQEYLAAGYPVASGVIEGACRHVVVDRMEGTGMRWVMQGRCWGYAVSIFMAIGRRL
jgi:hypothetical protein